MTVVDAAAGGSTLDRHEEAVKQAAVADRLLLSKSDLAHEVDIAGLERRLRGLNPAAPILRVVGGAVEPGRLFDAGLYDPQTKSLDVQRWLKAEAYADHADEGHAPAHGHHHNHGHDDHGHGTHDHHGHDVNRHDDHIRAVCLVVDRPIRASALELWLYTLQQLKGPDLLRMKGIVNVEGVPGPVVIHGVQHVFHPSVELKVWPSEDRRTRIVFITRDIDEQTLRGTLGLFTGEAPPSSPEAGPSGLVQAMEEAQGSRADQIRQQVERSLAGVGT